MNKEKKVILNIVVSTITQLITLVLGVILPRLILVNWGSEYNGLINSISTIMRYLALLEVGIGTSTLQALYKSIGEGDNKKISCVIVSAQSYYRKVAFVYAVFVVIVSFVYPLLLSTNIEYWTIFLVTVLQGCTGVINFAFRAAYQQLLNAEGRYYIISIISLLTTVLTYVAKIVAIALFDSIIIMQLLGVLIMTVQVLIYSVYFKKKYSWIDTTAETDMSLLENRKYYLVQQIAGLIFNGTDTIILSLFCGLKIASVYTIYNMIYSALTMVISILRTSTNFVLGQALHKSKEQFSKIYKAYTSLQVSLGCILTSCSMLLVISFVKLYTQDVSDIDYVNYTVPVLFSLNIILDCMRGANLAGANIAGQAPKTTWRYLVEAGINLSLSLILVKPLGIIGVLIGTITSGIWRSIDSIQFFYNRVLNDNPKKEYVFIVVNILIFGVFVVASYKNFIVATTYLQLVLYGIVTVLFITLIYGLLYIIYNKKYIKVINI